MLFMLVWSSLGGFPRCLVCLDEGVLCHILHHFLGGPSHLRSGSRHSTERVNVTTINEVPKLPKVPNLEYDTKHKEIDLEWRRDTIVDPAKWE